jgi:HEAT repeat protein
MPDEPPVSLLNEISYGDPGTVEPRDLIECLDSEEPSERQKAAEGLARIGATSAERIEPHVAELQQSLTTTSGKTRANVMSALAAVAQRTPPAVSIVPPVIEALSSDDAAVREWAALLIAYVGGPPATQHGQIVEQLKELTNDGDPSVRRNAALALARLDEADALEHLLTDDDEGVRTTAERILGK